jgi:hypothetical protein
MDGIFGTHTHRVLGSALVLSESAYRIFEGRSLSRQLLQPAASELVAEPLYASAAAKRARGQTSAQVGSVSSARLVRGPTTPSIFR